MFMGMIAYPFFLLILVLISKPAEVAPLHGPSVHWT